MNSGGAGPSRQGLWGGARRAGFSGKQAEEPVSEAVFVAPPHGSPEGKLISGTCSGALFSRRQARLATPVLSLLCDLLGETGVRM